MFSLFENLFCMQFAHRIFLEQSSAYSCFPTVVLFRDHYKFICDGAFNIRNSLVCAHVNPYATYPRSLHQRFSTSVWSVIIIGTGLTASYLIQERLDDRQYLIFLQACHILQNTLFFRIVGGYSKKHPISYVVSVWWSTTRFRSKVRIYLHVIFR